MKTKQNITAIIYDKHDNILSIGKNSYKKTHPVQAYYAQLTKQPYKIYLHAEIHAIVQLKHYHKPYKIQIIRQNQLPSKPCKLCMQAIQHYKIKEIECIV